MSSKLMNAKFVIGVITGAAIGTVAGTIGLSFADDDYSTSRITDQIVIPYDGYLSLNSTPINSALKMRFALYEDAKNVPEWREEQDVTVYNGRFSVALGSGSPLPRDPNSPNNPAIQTFRDVILDAEKLSLAIEVEDTSGNFVALSGRQAIEAAPYAAWSANASNLSVANSLSVSRDANIQGQLGVNGNSTLGGVSRSATTSIRGVDNNGAQAALSISSSASQTMLLDGNELDAIDGELFLQNNSPHDVRIKSDLAMDGTIKLGYTSWNSNDTGDGGAAITNDSGAFQALMIVGNDSGGDRRVEMYDDVYVADSFEVNGSANTGGSLSVGGNLDVTGSINGTVSSSCPGTPHATSYKSASNTRICVYRTATALSWPDSAERCHTNHGGAELCTYGQVLALAREGSLTINNDEHWLGNMSSDDNMFHTNRAITSATDPDLDNFDAVAPRTELKPSFCCLRITN